MSKNQLKKRIGFLGFGKLGQYLFKAIENNPQYEIVFIWNRSSEKIFEAFKELQISFPAEKILHSIQDIAKIPVDLVVEVSHPNVIKEHGAFILQYSDLFVGSPTAFADPKVEKELREATQSNHAIFIPSGAFWGAEDIEKMAHHGTIGSLTITMKKHPNSLKLEEPLQSKVNEYLNSSQTGEAVIYSGPVRDLCPLAPNNVNTMACGAIAAFNLGFDQVQARLIADKSLFAHIIQIDLASPIPQGKTLQDVFHTSTMRYNPATTGAVTGNATYPSFHSSLQRAFGFPNGIHFC